MSERSSSIIEFTTEDDQTFSEIKVEPTLEASAVHPSGIFLYLLKFNLKLIVLGFFD